jgi:3-oxoacyl-[acyl-carrier-protein] synthase II
MIRVVGLGWVSWQGYGMGPVKRTGDPPEKQTPDIPWSALFDAPDRQFSRMDAYSRIGLAAAVFAMRDARLDMNEHLNMGIVAATQNGCLQSDKDFFSTVLAGRGTTASPTLFAYTLPSSFIGEIAIRLGITGPGFVIQEAVLTGHAALEMAVDILESNEADAMLVGHCDIGPPGSIGAMPAPDLPAIFVVMRKDDSPKPGYGVLSVTSNGMSFRNHVISGHMDLAAWCLSHSAGSLWNG